MSNVISLDEKIPLEKRVEVDMRSAGYDPTNIEHINEYWEEYMQFSESVEITTMCGGKKFKVTITPLDEYEEETNGKET